MAARRHSRPSDESDAAMPGGTMGFIEHLEELRKRIIRSCLAIAAGMRVSFLFVDRIRDFVLAPTFRMLPPGSALMFIRPGEGFSFNMSLTFIAGFILAAPVVMFQVWLFIAPGLYAKEKKFAIPFVVLTTAGTIAGAAFSHYVLYPSMMGFFGTFSTDRIKFMPRLDDTVDLYLRMMLGMVVVFQIPTVVFFLSKMGLVTARFLWRNLKYAILIIFIAAAVLTPSADPWNQIAFAMPMIALYLLSIALAWMVRPRNPPPREGSPHLRLVVAATVLDHATRNRRRNNRHVRTTG
jgi:sec-independent protein translocase protein TatC